MVHPPVSAFDRPTFLGQATSLLHVAHGDPMGWRGPGGGAIRVIEGRCWHAT